MYPYDNYLNKLFNDNRKRFSDHPDIQWLKSHQAVAAQEKRDALVTGIGNHELYKATKYYHHQISEGCRLCGTGLWSCIFITNKCNASCFYCPAPQEKDEIPATQSLTFETPETYAAYINHFGFSGVSFSGGEPLLTFDRTINYLRTVRKSCNPNLYIWLYTNGILATEDKLKMLAEAGLNEIRFDIGATGYLLNKVRLAKGIIPKVTIEIPAIPEKKEKLKMLLPDMIEAGVTNLNLHQLRLTRHNATKLIQRRYTFIPAEQPIVLNSELAALEIINYAKEKDFQIGINYCSFFFKNRFQSSGFRKMLAKSFSVEETNITERGYLRTYNGSQISYKAFTISERENNDKSFQTINLAGKNCSIKLETVLSAQITQQNQKEKLEQMLRREPEEIPTDEFLFRIWQMEYIEKGLRNY